MKDSPSTLTTDPTNTTNSQLEPANQVKPAKRQRPIGLRYKASKLNRDKVQELAEQGLKPSDIAKHQGVAVSTVTRYLNSIKPLTDTIERYSQKHADILTLSQLKKQAVEDIIIESWLQNPEEIKRLDKRMQKEIIHTMQGGKYYDHQSERLERNQSTGNHTVIIGALQDLQRLRQDHE